MLSGPARSSTFREEEGAPEAGSSPEGIDYERLTHDGRLLVHVVATEKHFVDHLAPVWKALPPEVRGTFYTGGSPSQMRLAYLQAARVYGIQEVAAGLPKPHHHGLVLVAASGDLNRATKSSPKMRAVMFEHGCGLSYNRRQNSYAGARNRPNVDLFLFPNEASASKQREVHPDRKIVVLGSSPRLDPWAPGGAARSAWEPPERPVVALSFHWECPVVPETRSAMPFYRKHLGALLDRGWDIIGHAHPRIIDVANEVYASYGIEVVTEFDEVLARASLYAVDNSSTLYEFAATGRPVVTLNCPLYRKGVSHGLRFWEHIPGLQCDTPQELAPTIERALSDPPEAQELRRDAVEHVYPYHDGRATQRSIDLILEQLVSTSTHFPPPPPWKPAVEYHVVVGGEVIDVKTVRREAQVLAAKRGGTVSTIQN